MSIVYPEPAQAASAAQRTAQEWVDYYLEIESEVLAGKEVRFADDRVVVMEDLHQIRRARGEWERRAGQVKRRGVNNFGGLHYKTPDMSR